jgi:hypothetical protein
MNVLRVLDELEARAEPYLSLDAAERATGQELSSLVDEGVLLLDYRQRLTARGQLEPVTLCRLNRHHPRVMALSGW